MEHRRAAAVSTLVAGLLLASCSGSDGAPVEATAPKAIAPKVWLADACGVLTDARDIQGRPLIDQEQAPAIETQAQRQELRVALAEELDAREAAISDLASAMSDLGPPESRGGALLVQEVQRGLSELGDRYEQASAKVSKVPAGDPDVFAAGLSSALGEVDQGAPELDAARTSIFNDPAMVDLIPDTKACQEL